MKVSKLLIMSALVLAVVVCLATSTYAFSNSDLTKYLTGSHVINGSTYELNDSAKAQVKSYLEKNPVTDEQAAQIKANLEKAKSLVVAGAQSLNQMNSEKKSEIVSYVKAAGNIAGVEVSINTETQVINIVANGKTILSGTYALDGTNGLTVRTSAPQGGNGGGASAQAGSGSASGSTISGFARTGATVSVFAVAALVAVVAVSTVFIKKVNAK